MNTQQLKSFVSVAENLSFARAAELLNITQSAVSRQVHGLEAELGTKLFDRTTRTVVLTDDGIMFLEHAKHILNQLKIAGAKLRHHTNSHVQPLTIGCTSQMELELLGGILEASREQIMAFHPLLRILPHRSLLNLLFQGQIQVLCGFQENLPTKQGMAFEALYQLPLCCVLPRQHPLADREVFQEEDLFSQRMILCTSYTLPPWVLELQDRISRHISPEKILTCEHPDGVLPLIHAGYGFSILPRALRPDADLAYIPLADTPLLSYGLLYQADSSHPVLRKFLDVHLPERNHLPAVDYQAT